MLASVCHWPAPGPPQKRHLPLHQTTFLGGHPELPHTDSRQFVLAVTPSPLLWSTPEPPRAMCSAPSCSCSTPWLQSPTWRELCCEVCGQHHHHRPDYKQWWDLISGGNLQSCRMVHREQPTTQHQQNQGAHHWFWKKGHTHPCLHQWSWGGTAQQFKVPGNQHYKEPVMDISHLHPG